VSLVEKVFEGAVVWRTQQRSFFVRSGNGSFRRRLFTLFSFI